MGKHSDFHLSFFQIEVAWRDFTVVMSQNWWNFKSLDGFGGRFLKIRDVCMNFEPYFKVHNLISIYPESIKLGQMTNLNMIFDVVVSVYRLVKIWNSSQFPAEFRNGRSIIKSRATRSRKLEFIFSGNFSNLANKLSLSVYYSQIKTLITLYSYHSNSLE